MLICFEGMDGVGKSTVLKRVSINLNIPIIEKPINKLLNLNREQSKEITYKIYESYSTHMQALYYLMGYLSAVEDSKKNHLLMDRGFLSTYYFSFNNENSFLFDTFIKNYGSPDITVILYASIDERIKRIHKRNLNDMDLNKKRLYIDGYEKIFEGIKRYNMPYFLINTENITETETAELVSIILTLIMSNSIKKSMLTNIFSIENVSNIEKLSYFEILDIINMVVCDDQESHEKIKEKKYEKHYNE